MLTIESEVLRTCERAALTDNSLCQPLSCCAVLRFQQAALSTSTSPTDCQLAALTAGSKVTELGALHQKFLCIKVPMTACLLPLLILLSLRSTTDVNHEGERPGGFVPSKNLEWTR